MRTLMIVCAAVALLGAAGTAGACPYQSASEADPAATASTTPAPAPGNG